MKIAGVGAVVIIFGLHLTGILKIKALYADKRMHDVKGSSRRDRFVRRSGFAFAFGWTPCIGPILATILVLASAQASCKGVVLLAVYSLGWRFRFCSRLWALTGFCDSGRFRKHLHTVEVLSGILLIAIGVLIFLNNLKLLSGYLAFLIDSRFRVIL